MVGVEVRLCNTRLSFEDGFLTRVDHGFAKPFSIACLPIGAGVSVAEIGNQKAAVTNFVAKPGINKSSFGSVVEAEELEPGLIDCRPKIVIDQAIKLGVITSQRRALISARRSRSVSSTE